MAYFVFLWHPFRDSLFCLIVDEIAATHFQNRSYIIDNTETGIVLSQGIAEIAGARGKNEYEMLDLTKPENQLDKGKWILVELSFY